MVMGFLGNAFGFSSIICSVAKNAERLFKKKLNDTSYVPTLHCGTDGRWTGTGVSFVQSTLCMPVAGAHASNDVNRNEMQMMLHRHTQIGRSNFPKVSLQ